MKHITFILFGGILLLGAGYFWYITTIVPDEKEVVCPSDVLLCPDGTAVERIAPDCTFTPCQNTEDPLITIDTPKNGETISSPVTVSGKARGNWFFEASFPIAVVNWDGLIIGEGIATAEGEWMTTEFVPFTGTISFTLPENTPYNRGALIFKKDNPSGLSEFDDAREIPIYFKM